MPISKMQSVFGGRINFLNYKILKIMFFFYYFFIGLVEVTGEHREVNWFRQNLAIAVQRGNAFSILSADRERF